MKAQLEQLSNGPNLSGCRRVSGVRDTNLCQPHLFPNHRTGREEYRFGCSPTPFYELFHGLCRISAQQRLERLIHKCPERLQLCLAIKDKEKEFALQTIDA